MNTEYDVIVIGYGFAGGAAAIAAAEAGASVLLLEKMPDPGGISITSGGGLRVTDDAAAAFDYIRHSNDGRTPDANIRPIAEGMVWLKDWFSDLAAHCGARVEVAPRAGNYPFPGFDRLGMLEVTAIPGFDPARAYPHARTLRGGTRAGKGGEAPRATGGGAGVFHIVEANVQRLGIDVALGAPALRLLHEAGAVTGVLARLDGAERAIEARGGVVLACGGFESAPEMHRQYWQIAPVLSSACRGNTGDGIRMAQAVGADLWHMWHFHGTYGFRHPRHPEIGIRMKRLPDWRPPGYGDAGDAERRAAPMAWILLDCDGHRSVNEYGPYVQDTGHRDMEPYDPGTLRFPRVPAWVVFDEAGRQLYPIGSPVMNDRDPTVHYEWSADNLGEVRNGLLRRAETVEALAAIMNVPTDCLADTLEVWNACAEGRTADHFGRPRASMVPIQTGPFYCGQVWPIVSNTQGGPRHDAEQRILNPFDEPIPGLFAAGELGSIWGSLYTAGCNLAECFITGRIAGEAATGLYS